jgi:hypothetical protein
MVGFSWDLLDFDLGIQSTRIGSMPILMMAYFFIESDCF